MLQIEKIRNLATRFRLAIENLNNYQYIESPHFAVFPLGCCGDSAEMLKKFLRDNGIKAEYVSGT